MGVGPIVLILIDVVVFVLIYRALRRTSVILAIIAPLVVLGSIAGVVGGLALAFGQGHAASGVALVLGSILILAAYGVTVGVLIKGE